MKTTKTTKASKKNLNVNEIVDSPRRENESFEDYEIRCYNENYDKVMAGGK